MSKATSSPLVLYTVADAIATITLNDPERLNPIGHGPGSMEERLLAALIKADQDPAVHCIVVSAAGTAFSSGGDFGSAVNCDKAIDHLWFLENTDGVNEQIRSLRKPTLGAINGLCYGAGFMLAMHLDLLVAAEDARFGLIETRFGATGCEVLPLLIGAQWAKFLTLTGEVISAKRAKAIGLVLDVVPKSELEARVHALARRIACMPIEALILNKRALNAALTNAGWMAQKQTGRAINALTLAHMRTAVGAPGIPFMEILRQQGWAAFKQARDEPFANPWLQDPEDS
ncbi:MAG: enoyl-CoA hydratase/isomerase family protein [Steroidobacteraceae bacterium]